MDVGVGAGADGCGGEAEGFAVFDGGRVLKDRADGDFVAEFGGLLDFQIEASAVGVGDGDGSGAVEVTQGSGDIVFGIEDDHVGWVHGVNLRR